MIIISSHQIVKDTEAAVSPSVPPEQLTVAGHLHTHSETIKNTLGDGAVVPAALLLSRQ